MGHIYLISLDRLRSAPCWLSDRRFDDGRWQLLLPFREIPMTARASCC